ncbi:MAG: carbohydrate kinase family protein [Eubacteriales bacterium]|nr:carbohydrate kinase family protein [Eubacteriales bacterium]
MDKRVAVVGGCNVDLTATAYSSLIMQDSNPGRLEVSLGGVGRNIAENLARLDWQVSLVAPIGNDQFYPMIRHMAEDTGMDISHCLIVEGVSTSSYLCINRPNGDIAVAVAAMDICEKITPDVLAREMNFLNTFPYVVVDTNLPEESIAYLAQHCTARLFSDAVSSKKARKLMKALNSLYFLKTNRVEAEVLAGMSLQNNEDLEKAASILHKRGVKRVCITLGDDGAFFSDGSKTLILPQHHVHTVNSTGCGDAFLAGALCAIAQNSSSQDVLTSGLSMAAICAQAVGAVSDQLSPETLDRMVLQYKEEMTK